MLVGNKPKEVFGYVYSHPEVMERMVRHINQKSISEVLIRLLNVSETVLDGDAEISAADMDSLRQSFVFRILQRLAPSQQGGFEDHLNVQQVLSELVDYKSAYSELTSQRAQQVFRECLVEDCDSAKANAYQLLQNLVQKYKQNEKFAKKINISNIQDCADEINLDDDEEVLVFEDTQSEFFTFIRSVVTDYVAPLLQPPSE